jgi:hypothetical protein
MKKKSKKLVLAKETVKRLGDLNQAEGGDYGTNSGCNACTYDNSCRVFCLDEPIGP